MSQPVVEVRNVQKFYGDAKHKQTMALQDISFEVQKGEFIGIMGASGSGKSTLLNILSTLDKPTKGSVNINQKDITTLKGNALADFRSEETGFIFQEFNLLESLTAYENIALPLTLQGKPANEIKKRIQLIADRLSIKEILSKYPTEISGGQKQRVAAGRALITEPTILFGDEPTGALDSKSARDLLDMMQDLNENDKISILLVTHDPFSASYCHRILFIKDGLIGAELLREGKDRATFYQEILNLLGTFQQ